MTLPLIAILAPCTLLSQTRAEQSAANPLVVFPKDRVPDKIDNSVRVALARHVPPAARPENNLGPVPGDLSMPRMILTLARDADQQAALDAFSAALQNPQSPYFHKWLTPESFGAHFGLSQNDLNRITDWLKGLGFTIDDIPSGHWTVTFSGTAAQVENAFHPSIQNYRVAGEVRYANSSNPQIPAALAGIVSGIAGLNNFRPQRPRGSAVPNGAFTPGQDFLDPSDFATIYNLNPLYSKGINGNGVKIAVIEVCSMDVSSLAGTFWSLEKLTSQTSNWYWDYGTPPKCSSDDADEVYLDYEWSGALAPSAQIWLVSSNTSDQLLGAVQGVVTNNFAPVVTVSYSECESGGAQAWVDLWQQAHTQGITGLVASGDTGAAGCDSGTETIAKQGRAINGICASPYVVCVGGTQFNDTSNPNEYWSTTTGHALGYIPEIAWNESGTLGSSPTLWGSSGGGYSTIASKPAWQTGNTNTQRGVPDVALSSASHDGYRVCDGAYPCTPNYYMTIAGTSAAAPSFAGIMALVIQATGGQPQGSPNQTLYGLAAQPSLGVFHDIVTGNNSVNGVQGFSAGPGWDPVTGLGSVNATALVTNWPNASTGILAVTNLEMTKVNSTTCTVPPATSAFLTTDNNAYLYFGATLSASDNLTSDWLAPNGDVLSGVSWNPGAGTYCFTGASLDISNPKPGHLGGWLARIYDNALMIASTPFTVSSPASITGISPSPVLAGSGPFTLSVIGTGFVSGSTVLWNGSALPTSFLSATQLTATVAGALIVTAGSASIAVSSAAVVSNSVTIAILSSNLSRIGALSQVAAGGGWDTAVYLTNSTSGALSVALSFYADDGTALRLPLAVTQQGSTNNQLTSTLNAVIPPNTTLSVDTGSLSATVQGWADVQSNGSLTGFAVFRYALNGLTKGPTPWEGTVPLQTQLSPTLMIVPFDNTNGFATGVAVGNLTPFAVNLTAMFFDDNGNPLGSPQIIPLADFGHTGFVISKMFPFTDNTKGIMKISGVGLMGLGLRASPYGTLTAISVPLQ